MTHDRGSADQVAQRRVPADDICTLTNQPDTRSAWSDGGGFVKEANGHWSVDAEGRLSVKVTHVWVGVAFVDEDRIVKVSSSEITLKSGDRLRKR
jgi:hypothetical protein